MKSKKKAKEMSRIECISLLDETIRLALEVAHQAYAVKVSMFAETMIEAGAPQKKRGRR